MRNIRRYKGAFENRATRWGQHLTADHIASVHENMLGITGDKSAFVVMDLYSGLKHLYPVKTKDAQDTAASLRHFAGDRKVDVLYSDHPLGKSTRRYATARSSLITLCPASLATTP